MEVIFGDYEKIERIDFFKDENSCTDITYQIDQLTDDEQITIVLKQIEKRPYGILAYSKFKNINKTINSPFLNWKNLVACSNCWTVPPNKDYMNSAVQNGLKTTATAYVNSKEEYKSLVFNLPNEIFSMPYGTNSENDDFPNIVYLYRKGCLDDFFDMNLVKKIYVENDISYLNWQKINQMAKWELSKFGNESECGFSLQCGGNDNEIVIIGLLLGYPVESTVASIKHEDKIFNAILTNDVKKHFKNSKEPFENFFGEWLFDGNHYYLNGQQEELYY